MGSIPALAGERDIEDTSEACWTVYPRACGGTVAIPDGQSLDLGLSPRLRGNATLSGNISASYGSIPALAGERCVSHMVCLRTKVYPRACGGTYSRSLICNEYRGLSPRLRGNGIFKDSALVYRRSIPALAGERLYGPTRSWSLTVYPRACGGTIPGTFRILPIRGLSPRLRGNDFRNQFLEGIQRSIPALAGERPGESVRGNVSGVYPRACGGTLVSLGKVRPWLGLSPRLRGNDRTAFSNRLIPGSIPALAGERCTSNSSLYNRRVYPRACGGTVRAKTMSYFQRGLSPRLRGNGMDAKNLLTREGSIPALAGERYEVLDESGIVGVYPRACGGT